MTNLITILATQAVINAVCTSEIKTNAEEYFVPPELWSQLAYINVRQPPTEKWVHTVIVREDVLKFDWLGAERKIVQVTPMSTNVVHLRVKTEWEEVK